MTTTFHHVLDFESLNQSVFVSDSTGSFDFKLGDTVPIDVNVENESGWTALTLVKLLITKNTRYRNEVAETGEKAKNSSKTSTASLIKP